MIIEIFTTGPIQTNSILIGCESTKKGAIFDAPLGSAEHILKKCEELDLDIQGLYLTHSHWDHIGNCHILKLKLNIPIYVHALDVENVKNPGSDQVPSMAPIESAEPDGFLHDKDSIQVGRFNFKVIHTPGHSPGSVCFFEPNEKILISGDTLFQGSMGTTQLPTSDPAKMVDSLKKLSLLPEDVKVFPGHGPTTTIKDESWIKKVNKFLR